jgi:ribonuclease P protein component
MQKPQGISSEERIKSKKEFDELYSNGKIILSQTGKLKAIFISGSDVEEGVKMAAVVAKKLGKAVWRNRVRRLIKESYRLNKHILLKKYNGSGKNLKIIFSANSLKEINHKSITLNDVMPEVVELMQKVLIKR